MKAKGPGTRPERMREDAPSLVCNNLSISTTTTSNSTSTKPTKLLLRSFTCTFQPRNVVGILGPSGCGKTSLLRAIHQCTPSEPHQLFYNSQQLTTAAARFHFSHLQQEDLLPSYLTVSEYLFFCARLYEPSLNSNKCQNGIDYLLQRLHLESCANVRIESVSGGQQRRVSVCRCVFSCIFRKKFFDPLLLLFFGSELI